MVVRHAEHLELLAHPADADAEDHPPLRQGVERGDRLGRVHRRAVAEDQHGRGELDPLGAAGDEEHRADRVQPRHVHRRGERAVVGVRVTRGDVLRPGDVVAHPAGVEAERLGVLGELDQVRSCRLASEVREVDAPIHGDWLAARQSSPPGRAIRVGGVGASRWCRCESLVRGCPAPPTRTSSWDSDRRVGLGSTVGSGSGGPWPSARCRPPGTPGGPTRRPAGGCRAGRSAPRSGTC